MSKETTGNPIPEIKLHNYADTLHASETEFTYRTGPAAKLIEPVPVRVAGDIKTIGSFLKIRYLDKVATGLQQVDPSKAIVYVDKANRTVKIELDAESIYGSSVEGTVQLAPELAPFGINTGKIFDREDFIQLLKFNGIYFTDRTAHKTLLLSIQKHSSSIIYKNNETSDERGNKESQFRRDVETSVPNEFVIDIPIFKGYGTETIRVDVCIGVKAGKLEFWFESVQLHELIQVRLDIIINEQLKNAEGLVIVYK